MNSYSGIILASVSPRRRRLMGAMGLKFRIIPSAADETTSLVRPSAIVRELALRKARSIASKYPAATVIGADTIVVCKGLIIGKPVDKKDALRILSLQNGSWQSVYTGVSVICRNKGFESCEYEVSKCRARKLPLEKLELIGLKHMDKAGAYAVQDNDDVFIEKIVGNRDNVVGLPCGLLRKMLKKCAK